MRKKNPKVVEDPMLQRGKRSSRFNLVEITVSLMVILVALVAVGSLLPRSMQTSQDSVSRLCAADSGDQFLNFLATEMKKDWDIRMCMPLTKDAVVEESNPVFSSTGLLSNQNLLVEFQADNAVDDWDPAVYTDGVFRVTQKTRTNGMDFQGIAHVWRENVVDPEGDDNPTSVRLHVEISWPAEVAYTDRKKTRYNLLVTNPRPVYAEVSAPAEGPEESQIIGQINLNPSNGPNFEFNLMTEDGSEITRDTLHAAGSSYTWTGLATYIRFKPKGNGNQNSLIVDGETYSLENKNVYEITGDALSVHIYNSNNGNGNAMGKWYAQISLSEGTIACASVGAVAEEEEEEEDLFEIAGGEVSMNTDVDTTFLVLGCAIKYGSSDCYVTSQVVIDGHNTRPFGNYNNPRNGNINDGNTHSYNAGVIEAGKQISVDATSWLPNRRKYMEVTSSPASQQVLVLKNGDAIPEISGMDDQADLESYISDYIDMSTRTIALEDNQVIFLFELGTTNMQSSAADFQDMVMLVTMTPE